MMEETEGGKCPNKVVFQQKLDKWFQSRGIISDLRSHLRHLMVTALQNTKVGLSKGTDKISPKTQALNLLVAEYLLRQKCHYTLSVFTSEVPTLSSFCNAPIATSLSKRPTTNHSKEGYEEKKNCFFQRNELEDLLNALGLPGSLCDVQRMKMSYLQETNTTSLLELFIKTILEMTVKLDISQNFEKEVETSDECLLSTKWTSKVAEILMKESISVSQVGTIEKAIFSVTEAEVKHIIDEHRRKQVQFLLQREKRIQEYLREYEENILLRLREAEKNLIVRKDSIDDELNERQKHLSKMALEWTAKHDEMIKLSKNLYMVNDENKTLRIAVERLKEEKEILKAQEQRQKESIDVLREEMSCNLRRLEEATRCNMELKSRLEALPSKSATEKGEKIFPVGNYDGNTKNDKTRADTFNEQIKVPNGEAKAKTHLNDNCGNGHYDKDEWEDSFLEPSPDEIVCNVREKLLKLEEQFSRVNRNYLEYKNKFSPTIASDSDSSTHSSKDSLVKGTFEPICQDSGSVFKVARFSQTDDEMAVDGGSGKMLDNKANTSSIQPTPSNEHIIERLAEKWLPKHFLVKSPSKRQMKNRQFFLENRKLVEELENEKNSTRTGGGRAASPWSILSSNSSVSVPDRDKEILTFEPCSDRTDSSSLLFPENSSSERRVSESACNKIDVDPRSSRKTIPRRKMLRQQIVVPSEEDDAEN